MSQSGDRNSESSRAALSAFHGVKRLRIVSQMLDLGAPVVAAQADELLARVKALKRTTHAMLSMATLHVHGDTLVLNFAHPPIARQFSIAGPAVVLAALSEEREPMEEAERLVVEALGGDGPARFPTHAARMPPTPTGVQEMRSCWLRLVRTLEDSELSGGLSGAPLRDISSAELEVAMPLVTGRPLTEQQLDEIAQAMTSLGGRHVSTYLHGLRLRMRIATRGPTPGASS